MPSVVSRRHEERAVSLQGPAGELEAIARLPAADPIAVAVICHPHPGHHGTMNNKVVTTLSRAFADYGAVAVRFNFRGVGHSEGQYDGGAGELEDAAAAADWSMTAWPGVKLLLAGYSFGGAVAIRLAAQRNPGTLVTVAPAVDRVPADQARPPCDWLIIQGDHDETVSTEKVLTWARAFQPEPSIAVMREADHFYHGRLTELREIVQRYLSAEREK